MNREAFLSQLSDALRDMPEADRSDVLGYFDELIQDKAADRGVSEEEVVAELGSIGDIVRSVRASEAAEGGEAAPRGKPLEDDQIGSMVFSADANAVRSLVLRVDNSRVTVRPGQGDKLEIRYTQTQHHRYTATIENGEVVFRQLRASGLLAWGISAFLGQEGPVEVTLPREFAGKADLGTTNAKINWEGVSAWGSVILDTKNSAIVVSDMSARDISATSTNGRVSAQQVKAQAAFKLQTTNGKVEAIHVEADAVSLTSTNGGVRIEEVKAQDIALRTTNGNIDGVILGSAAEYTVNSGTTNGHDNLASHTHTGPKRLSARTTNASIRLVFSGDARA